MRQDQKNRMASTPKVIAAVVCHMDPCNNCSGAYVFSENDTAPAATKIARFLITTILTTALEENQNWKLTDSRKGWSYILDLIAVSWHSTRHIYR